VISSLEPDGQTVPPGPSAGAELTLWWRHGSCARVDRRDDRDVGEEREVPSFGHPKTPQFTTATSVTNGLNTLPEYVRSAGSLSFGTSGGELLLVGDCRCLTPRSADPPFIQNP
jgi:hypothetical protein